MMQIEIIRNGRCYLAEVTDNNHAVVTELTDSDGGLYVSPEVATELVDGVEVGQHAAVGAGRWAS